jgi:hypothetical protein
MTCMTNRLENAGRGRVLVKHKLIGALWAAAALLVPIAPFASLAGAPAPAAGSPAAKPAEFDFAEMVGNAYRTNPYFTLYAALLLAAAAVVIFLIIYLRCRHNEKLYRQADKARKKAESQEEDAPQAIRPEDRSEGPVRQTTEDIRFAGEEARDMRQENEQTQPERQTGEDAAPETRDTNEALMPAETRMEEPSARHLAAAPLPDPSLDDDAAPPPDPSLDDDYREDISRYTRQPGVYVNDISRNTQAGFADGLSRIEGRRNAAERAADTRGARASVGSRMERNKRKRK